MKTTANINRMWSMGALMFALVVAVAAGGNAAFADERLQVSDPSDKASDGVQADKAKFQTPWVYRHQNHRHKLPIHKGLKPSFTKKHVASAMSDAAVQETATEVEQDAKAEATHKKHESKKERKARHKKERRKSKHRKHTGLSDEERFQASWPASN
jgi:hypothetical protein